MMNLEETYEFDLNGYIIYRDILSPEEVNNINNIIDSSIVDIKLRGDGKFSFFELDPYFMELMAHPRTLEILRGMLGDWLRFDHALGIEMTKTLSVHENLHAGPLENQLAFFYQWCQGKMRNGLIKVIYALSDVNPGHGGFICVPGSHKGNVKYRPRHDSHLVVNPSMKAGDMLIFTEALVHGSRQWTADHRRRVLIYSYAPGCLAWMSSEWSKPYQELANNDLQRNLLRPPSVGEYNQEANVVQLVGKWPSNRWRSALNFPKDESMQKTEVREYLKRVKQLVCQLGKRLSLYSLP